MERETRGGIPAEIRAEGDTIKVAGYAAVFGQETNIAGAFIEVIDRGAFRDAVGRDDVVFLINHDGLPLARTRSGTLTLREDDHGLYMETELDARDPDVASIVYKMQRGDLDKMSFAFWPTVQEWDDSGALPKRTIKEASLYDVSIVTTPAYDGTEIGLRSLQDHRAQQRAKNFHAARSRVRMKLDLAARQENG
jgi:HK97 family phage prohead protease